MRWSLALHGTDDRMNILVATLIIVAFATLAIAMGNLFGAIPAHIIEQSKMIALPAIAISSGVLIASITYLRDKASQTTERQRKSDEIYLKLARDSFDEVFDLLKDKNNDRIIWVRASRLLLQTLALKREIKTPDIVKGFSLAEERLRTELYRVLSVKSSEHSSRQPLPPQFFYGIEDWETESSLDEAARKSRGKIEAHSVVIDKNIPEPELRPLSQKSVIAIYNFLKFPDNYDDPLPDVADWTDNWQDSPAIEQGAKRFVAHNNDHYVVNGTLHKRG